MLIWSFACDEINLLFNANSCHYGVPLQIAFKITAFTTFEYAWHFIWNTSFILDLQKEKIVLIEARARHPWRDQLSKLTSTLYLSLFIVSMAYYYCDQEPEQDLVLVLRQYTWSWSGSWLDSSLEISYCYLSNHHVHIKSANQITKNLFIWRKRRKNLTNSVLFALKSCRLKLCKTKTKTAGPRLTLRNTTAK